MLTARSWRMGWTRWLVAGGLSACAAADAAGDGGGDGDGGDPGPDPPACCDAAAGGGDGADAVSLDPACAAAPAPRHGYPADFPELHDTGGFGQGQPIAGFGGDVTGDRACNRAALARRPVILLHGNGSVTTHETFGMVEIAAQLRAAGYHDAELWAPSYLGQDVSLAETQTPTRNNVDDVRVFVDAVIDYLGVERVDVVSHSLGCGLANGYLRGLRKDGSFDPALARFDRVGTVVCLGGALYGTGSGFLYQPEFDTQGEWVAASLTLEGVEDATPFGAASAGDMIGPTTGGTLPGGRPFLAATALDGGARRLTWVALWAIDDLVDANLENAGGLGGADLNRGFVLADSAPGVLSAGLARHVNLLHDPAVFAAFLPYLDR